MLLSQRRGTIKQWFNGDGGYGFIHPDTGGKGVFVHHTGIGADAKAKFVLSTRVTYEVVNSKMGGLWAKNVCSAED